MQWKFEEALVYYASQGAPKEQSALILLLKEIQQEYDGSIPKHIISTIAEKYCIQENYLLAIIKRIPSLRLADTHLLEICTGPNCGKHTALAAFAETLRGSNITVKWVPCMRMCSKGPNIKWDGNLYHGADVALLEQLIESITSHSKHSK